MATFSSYHKSIFSVCDNRSETQSEISSVDSEPSDLRTIAAQLCLTPEELSLERFKIDRQKLEEMMKVESEAEGINKAEQFFDSVMKETTTHISWPCRLKIGAKTKKDPHVKITGKYENVIKAKERVMTSLDSRGTRVTLKMDISYTDHSFIIGKGGNIIKNIMEETKTHIHFPDSNRTNHNEKSNQVSLNGTLEGVERARSLVRLSAPLVLQFELPIMPPGYPIPDSDTPYIKDIQNIYDIQVSFSIRSKLHALSVLVKGSERNYIRVKQATQLLINKMCDTIAAQIEVSLQLEITPQHHYIVKGKDNRNLRKIMEITKTKIIFPDINDINMKAVRRSQVSIAGNIEGVYIARQLLLGNLPVALMFDYPDNSIEPTEVAKLNNTLDVFITVRHKSRQSTLCVVIKGIEKYIDNVYEARKRMLKLRQPALLPDIPDSYYFQDEDRNQLNLHSLLSIYPDSPMTPNIFGTNRGNSPSYPDSPYENINPLLNRNNHGLMATNSSNNNNNRISKIQPSIVVSSTTNEYSDTNKFNQAQVSNNNNNNNINNNNNNNNKNNNNNNISPRNASNNTSGYQSFSSSTASLDHLGNYNNTLNQMPSTSTLNTSQDTAYYSQSRNTSFGSSPQFMNDSSSDARTPTYEMKRHFDHSPIFDFNMKKLEGLKAMECQPRGNEIRTPTSSWAGLGLSRTSPLPEMEPIDGNSMSSWNREDVSPYHLGKTSGILDVTPIQCRGHIPHHPDLQSLLTSMGLEHYIKIFLTNEIDLDMFASLTERDLTCLGITAFGARKKLLMAINSLATRSIGVGGVNGGSCNTTSSIPPKFSGSAAPGAERRPSSGW